MKKQILLYSLIPALVITPTICLSSCKNKGDKYVALPSSYLKITNGILDGLNEQYEEEDLSKYDTLQVPSNVITTKSFAGSETKIGYNCVKNIVYSSSSKWETISEGCFSYLVNLEKIVFPSSLKTIAGNAFLSLDKLNTLDVSNIDNVSNVFKSECFNDSLVSYAVKNGTL